MPQRSGSNMQEPWPIALDTGLATGSTQRCSTDNLVGRSSRCERGPRLQRRPRDSYFMSQAINEFGTSMAFNVSIS
eukprot:2267428-Alexandrium_andersonii.AAC.1